MGTLRSQQNVGRAMQIIKFTIYGTHEGPEKNPIGYHRTTQKAKWAPEHQRYEKWKDHVRQAFNRTGYRNNKNLNIKPIVITKDKPARVDIDIEYKDEIRPDNDNVFKGILDALFVNDKFVMAGSFESAISAEKIGRVKVKVTLY